MDIIKKIGIFASLSWKQSFYLKKLIPIEEMKRPAVKPVALFFLPTPFISSRVSFFRIAKPNHPPTFSTTNACSYESQSDWTDKSMEFEKSGQKVDFKPLWRPSFQNNNPTDAYTRISRDFQPTEKKALVFSLQNNSFQNGSFYTRKWAFLLLKMILFEKQNGPFCDVKRSILKIEKKNPLMTNGFFAKSEAIGLLKWQKNLAQFYGKFIWKKCYLKRSKSPTRSW